MNKARSLAISYQAMAKALRSESDSEVLARGALYAADDLESAAKVIRYLCRKLRLEKGKYRTMFDAAGRHMRDAARHKEAARRSRLRLERIHADISGALCQN